MNAKDALKELKAGNKRFLGHDPINYPTEKERKPLGKGQNPYAVILCCADSRVSPEVMFNAGLNELFVIRIAGNIATTEAIGSIEYAVAHLETKLIVVVGHEKCGAVDAAIKNLDKPLDSGYHLDSLVGHITPAVVEVGKKPKYRKRMTKALECDRLDETVRENAERNAELLRSRSRIIAGNSDVKIVWAYYPLIEGKVEFSKYV